MGVYVDTSVLGAYYCPEALSLKADKVMQDIAHPVISLLTEVEFFSLVAKKRRQRDFSDAKAKKIQDEFLAHMANGYYGRVAIPVGHYLKARDMIAQLKTTLHTLDAIHLAITLQEKLPLITADKGLVAAARHFKVKATLVS